MKNFVKDYAIVFFILSFTVVGAFYSLQKEKTKTISLETIFQEIETTEIVVAKKEETKPVKVVVVTPTVPVKTIKPAITLKSSAPKGTEITIDLKTLTKEPVIEVSVKKTLEPQKLILPSIKKQELVKKTTTALPVLSVRKSNTRINDFYRNNARKVSRPATVNRTRALRTVSTKNWDSRSNRTVTRRVSVPTINKAIYRRTSRQETINKTVSYRNTNVQKRYNTTTENEALSTTKTIEVPEHLKNDRRYKYQMMLRQKAERMHSSAPRTRTTQSNEAPTKKRYYYSPRKEVINREKGFTTANKVSYKGVPRR